MPMSFFESTSYGMNPTIARAYLTLASILTSDSSPPAEPNPVWGRTVNQLMVNRIFPTILSRVRSMDLGIDEMFDREPCTGAITFGPRSPESIRRPSLLRDLQTPITESEVAQLREPQATPSEENSSPPSVPPSMPDSSAGFVGLHSMETEYRIPPTQTQC